jgi:hypothetical protein
LNVHDKLGLVTVKLPVSVAVPDEPPVVVTVPERVVDEPPWVLVTSNVKVAEPVEEAVPLIVPSVVKVPQVGMVVLKPLNVIEKLSVPEKVMAKDPFADVPSPKSQLVNVNVPLVEVSVKENEPPAAQLQVVVPLVVVQDEVSLRLKPA